MTCPSVCVYDGVCVCPSLCVCVVRLLSADSTEILQLSGDLRCFLVADSPIAAFLASPQMLARVRRSGRSQPLRQQQQQEQQGQEEEEEEEGEGDRPSFIRRLFLLCVGRSVQYLLACLSLFAAGAAVRMVLLSG